jgi:hypothetical protein
MGNTSTIDYDNECYDYLAIDDIEFMIDCYVEKRWFIFKLTKSYELLIYEIVKNDLLDVKYFDFDDYIPSWQDTDKHKENQMNMIRINTELHTSSTSVKEEICIQKCVLRRTELTDLTDQIVFLTDLIDKKTHPDNEDIQKYLDILIFFQKNNM